MQYKNELEILNGRDVDFQDSYFDRLMENNEFSDFINYFLEYAIRKKIKPKKRKKAVDPLHNICKNIFIEFYNKKHKEKYYWTGKDAFNLDQLTKKLKSLIEKYSDDKLVELFTRFITKTKDCENWISNNYTIPNLNGQFNSLIIKIQSKPYTKQVRVRTIDGGSIISVLESDYLKNKHYYTLIEENGN
jgi:hypothetical protein